jgi:hypothetical protein
LSGLVQFFGVYLTWAYVLSWFSAKEDKEGSAIIFEPTPGVNHENHLYPGRPTLYLVKTPGHFDFALAVDTPPVRV